MPSATLLANLRAELIPFAPFAQMKQQHVDRFIIAATETYFAPGEKVLAPEDGPVRQLYCIRQGSVSARSGAAQASQYVLGDLFPVGAVMGARPVSAAYTAAEDTFCLQVPADDVRQLAADSPPLADFLSRRVLRFLDQSQQALHYAFASQTLAEQSLETPLGVLPRKAPVAVAPSTPLADALALMHDQRVGSLLVLDDGGAALGILTRYDILGRVTLPRLPLATPIAEVMTAPVVTLSVHDTAHEAALAMSRHGIRHVPVTEAGRVVGIVSERDLFALQRLSLKQLSTTLAGAGDIAALRAAAPDIRRFARHLLGQGVRARQLTELISHLNDVLTARLVELVAAQHGMDLRRACWLAFGSEGRHEQTVATDQDNGLVFDSDDPARDRPRWLAFARAVNEALDACGFPLCKGNVMASNPALCLAPQEWRRRFEHWIEHGAPQDLLNASICFDLRALAGNAELARPLRELIATHARRVPRFLKQMAENALAHAPPLNFLGGIETKAIDGREVVDLKLQGTAIFVDAARLYALAHGIDETGTRRRFEASARALELDPHESEGWIGGFEFLQLLRLQAQMSEPAGSPNLADVATLNDIDLRVLKECLRIARRLQQRIELDYRR